MNHPRRLLGITASLRSARRGVAEESLLTELASIENLEQLLEWIGQQSRMHLEQFLEAGRREGKPFEEIYRNLQKLPGNKGLSNSEAALAAALWAARQDGTAIGHLSLSDHFKVSGKVREPDLLRRRLLESDGILLSGPVYFGDRSSLAESLVDFIARDETLRQSMEGRLFGAISVGAKRNGGQETTLIYQMLDMMALGFLAVGNDSDTTAQYGGTCHAGDVGTIHKDRYGIDTSMGVGRRMSHVLDYLHHDHRLKAGEAPRVLFLILQDADGIGLAQAERLTTRLAGIAACSILDLSSREIHRCIACDICPTHVDLDEIYRCIIHGRGDALESLHEGLLHHDMLVPVTVTLRDRSRVRSNYQSFMERTRYLRRGDYLWSDLVVAPLSFTDHPGEDLLPVRMITSLIRHHTVVTHPSVVTLGAGGEPDLTLALQRLNLAVRTAARLTAGRLAATSANNLRYNPVGYILSAHKSLEDERHALRQRMVDERKAQLQREAERRLDRAPDRDQDASA
ncbi:MAG: flavodoxin family protein [Magnetococcales bacterium]|nr:flavodoxin family protein [Magnetococcales bacterium]